jgi:hypothetical protein
LLAVVSGVAVSAQDKYALKLPNGVSFGDFEGYGDWQLISSSKTDDRMKVILGDSTIIAAFKSGIPDTQTGRPGTRLISWQSGWATNVPSERRSHTPRRRVPAVDCPPTTKQVMFVTRDDH